MACGQMPSSSLGLIIMWLRLACICCFVLPMMANDSDLSEFESKLASIMDRLNDKESIGIYGDVISLERTKEGERSDSEDPLVRRIDEFLTSRKLRIRFPNDESSADFFGRALGQKNVEFELRGLVHGASEGNDNYLFLMFLNSFQY